MMIWQIFFLILLFAALLMLLLPPKTHSFTKDILKERREGITSRRLSKIERLTVRIQVSAKNAGFSMRTYFVITGAAFFAGIGGGAALFGMGELSIATGVAFLPLGFVR